MSGSPVVPPPAHGFPWPVRLRAVGRVLLFVALVTAFTLALRAALVAARVRLPAEWSSGWFALAESVALAAAVLATTVMSRVDRLPFARFGIPWRAAFGARFWEGALWGFAVVGGLVGAVALLGGYDVHGFALAGPALARAALAWVAAMVLLGLAEEVVFRGYPLAALADGIGFWPASIVLSLLFSGLHYFGKPMENVADALSVGLIGLFLCFTLRRTGSLWFAIGFHFAFDFAALPFFGSPNTGNNGHPAPGQLLDGTFHGPDWLTGGVRGVEASLLVFVAIALLFATLHVRFPATRFPPERS